MPDQQTRNNHYVPQWYQRGFLAVGQSRLFYLNLDPDHQTLPDGRIVSRTALHQWGTKNCFVEYDLYTTRFGSLFNDDVEKYLFGAIDDSGAKAVRAFANDQHTELHESFQAFFEYMAAQKLRTPKGLDWIRSCYGELGQTELMIEMQALRLMHCTMWAEGVREIVSAQDSDVKFILTDHPVTVYNPVMDPASRQCAYPQDPQVASLGSQTVFALDANTCLIITNLEYAKDADQQDLTRLRTNARHLGAGMTRTDNVIRERKLRRDEVIMINHLLKSRAKRYIAAAKAEWLYPEQELSGSWKQITQILLPKTDLWRFGGEIYVGYADGTSGYWDEYGRTSKAHQFLVRESPRTGVGADDFCGCGSAYAFKNCCQQLSPNERPSWNVYGLRERNLIFCNAVQKILGLTDGRSWKEVRRSLNEEHIERIHRVFASLWPEDTDLASLLPRPNSKILRSVYMGVADPRTVEAAVLGWLPFVDEIILINPFFLGWRMKSEFSPIESPKSYKMQTLKNVVLLLKLEPFIRTGIVHLVPDPGEVNAPFGNHLREALKRSTSGCKADNNTGLHSSLKLVEEEHERLIWMLPEVSQRKLITENMPDADDAEKDQLVKYFKCQAEEDLYTLLQPLPVGRDAAQIQAFKGFSLEAAMYVASLTGSIIHVDSDACWMRLLRDAQPNGATSRHTCMPVRQALGEISFPVELDAQRVAERLAREERLPIGSLLRRLVVSVTSPASGPAPIKLAKHIRQARSRVERKGDDSTRLKARLELHVPPEGFSRHEVQRLLVMFAGVTRPLSIPYALRLVFDEGRDGEN